MKNLKRFISSKDHKIQMRESNKKDIYWGDNKRSLYDQKKILDQYKETLEDLSEIREELKENLKREGSNYSAFVRNLISKGVSLSTFVDLEESEKDEIMDMSVENYFENYSNSKNNIKTIFDVLYDDGSSRRSSQQGTEKMEKEFHNAGYEKLTEDCYDFNKNNFYFFPDRGGKKLFKDMLEKEVVNFGFSEKKQGKLPDAVFKKDNDIYIIEHKNLNESGGAQNHQIGELIDFIRFRPEKPHFHYVSYLTGLFTKKIKRPQTTKNKQQRDTIVRQLRQTPENEFLMNSLEQIL